MKSGWRQVFNEKRGFWCCYDAQRKIGRDGRREEGREGGEKREIKSPVSSHAHCLSLPPAVP